MHTVRWDLVGPGPFMGLMALLRGGEERSRKREGRQRQKSKRKEQQQVLTVQCPLPWEDVAGRPTACPPLDVDIPRF